MITERRGINRQLASADRRQLDRLGPGKNALVERM
jgi:hypothetical protein